MLACERGRTFAWGSSDSVTRRLLRRDFVEKRLTRKLGRGTVRKLARVKAWRVSRELSTAIKITDRNNTQSEAIAIVNPRFPGHNL
jgi:hypothetical protein